VTSPRELLANVYATAGTRDWDAVEALIHPDFVLYEANSARQGRAATLRGGDVWHLGPYEA
jgi:hypothetical protein